MPTGPAPAPARRGRRRAPRKHLTSRTRIIRGLLALLVALLIVAAFFLTPDTKTWDPTPGDMDGDGIPDTRDRDAQTLITKTPITIDLDSDGTPDTHAPTPDGERVSLTELTDQLNTVTTQIAADPDKTDPSEVLLTPSGENWWLLVTSVAPELHLDTSTAPQDATWYAVTGQTATQTTITAEPTPYSALHVAFATRRAAEAWVETTSEHADSAWRFPLIRDNLVTYAPIRANPHGEPYDKTPDTNFRPKAALWVTHLGRQHEQTIHASPWPEQVRTYYTSLGFTADTVWTAVATTPLGPWSGQLTGYSREAINPQAANEAIATTDTITCTTQGNCTQIDDGLTDLSLYSAWVTPTGEGIGANTNLLHSDPPKNVLLNFGYAPGPLTGVLDNSTTTYHGDVTILQGWISDDLTMTRYGKTGDIPLPG